MVLFLRPRIWKKNENFIEADIERHCLQKFHCLRLYKKGVFGPLVFGAAPSVLYALAYEVDADAHFARKFRGVRTQVMAFAAAYFKGYVFRALKNRGAGGF